MNQSQGDSPVAVLGSVVGDPEVPSKPMRRKFPAEYKMRILQEADACREAGQTGALLRREGLYASQLSCWRKAREEGLLVVLGPRKRGRKPRMNHALSAREAKLMLENRRLKRQLEQAHKILEIQKKASELLGIPLGDAERTGSV